MSISGITPQQLRCFNYIDHFIRSNDHSPTLEEVKVGMGLRSKGNVVRLFHALRDRGWINFQDYTARSVSITRPAKEYTLPPSVEAALTAYCAKHGEVPADIVSDAVVLFLDQQVGEQAA